MSLENNPQNNIETKINHSGNAPDNMRETPVNDFDNTTLQEAVDQNLIGVPKTTEAIGSWAPSTETTPSTIEKKAFSKKQKIIAGISGAALALGIGVGFKAMNGDDERIAPAGPVATAPVAVKTEQAPPTASETTKPVETKTSFETFMASFDISAEKYTTPQTVTAAYYERYNNWINAGLTVESDQTLLGDEVTTVRDVEAKFDSGITSRLFTTSETATSLITSINELRAGTIKNYLMSQRRGDAVPYISNDELLSVKLASSDNPDLTKATAFGVHAQILATDNGNQNIAPYYREHNAAGQIDITRNDDINFVRDVATNTWKVDSSYLISSVDRSK